MSDDRPTRAMEADLELITRYLNGELDEKRSAEVVRRAETDEPFAELVGPVVWAWNVPRKPRPAGELERHLEEFTRRAGFNYQKRKARRRRLWIIAIVALAIGIPLYVGRNAIRAEIADRRDYAAVPFDTGWIRLLNGAEVRIDRETELRAAKRLGTDSVYRLKLKGSAVFRVPPAASPVALGNARPIAIETRGAELFTLGGELVVSARGDTTTVEVPRRVRRTMEDFTALSTIVYMRNDAVRSSLRLNERERGRAIRGRAPEKLP